MKMPMPRNPPSGEPPPGFKPPAVLPVPSIRPSTRIKRPPAFWPKERYEPKLPPYDKFYPPVEPPK
jgi:hypothetical protein